MPLIIQTGVKHLYTTCPGEILAKVVNRPLPTCRATAAVAARRSNADSFPDLMVDCFYCGDCGASYEFPPGKPDAAVDIPKRLKKEWDERNSKILGARLEETAPPEVRQRTLEALSNIQSRQPEIKQA